MLFVSGPQLCVGRVGRDWRGATVRNIGEWQAWGPRSTQVSAQSVCVFRRVTRISMRSVKGAETSLLDGDGERRWCGHVMTVLIIASLLPLCFKESSPSSRLIEYACVPFIADYLARWATADSKLGKGALSFLIYPSPHGRHRPAVDPASLQCPQRRAAHAASPPPVSGPADVQAHSLLKSASNIAAVFERGAARLGLAIGYILRQRLAIFNVEPETFNTFFDAVYWAVVSPDDRRLRRPHPTSDVGRAIMISSLIWRRRRCPARILTAGMLDELRRDDDEMTDCGFPVPCPGACEAKLVRSLPIGPRCPC